MRRQVIGIDFSGAMDASKKIRLNACIFVVPVFLDDSHDTSYRLERKRRLMFRGDREDRDFSESREKESVLRPRKVKNLFDCPNTPGECQ